MDREASFVLGYAELLLLDRDRFVLLKFAHRQFDSCSTLVAVPIREFALARSLLVLLILHQNNVLEVFRGSDEVDHRVLAQAGLFHALVAAVAPSGLLSDLHIFPSSMR